MPDFPTWTVCGRRQAEHGPLSFDLNGGAGIFLGVLRREANCFDYRTARGGAL